MAPRAADVEVWLDTSAGSRLPVLASTRERRWCRASGTKVRCQVRLGVPAQGVWTAGVVKDSTPSAAVEVTVASTPV